MKYSEASERNKGPILNILKDLFRDCGTVLEIGSGTGQHAVHFSINLPHLTWQPAELEGNLEDLVQRIEREGPGNLKKPIVLDVNSTVLNKTVFDAVFTANTAHIMPWDTVVAMFKFTGGILGAGGLFCVYGPFKYSGKYTSKSNEEFDSYLRELDPTCGIRDIEQINVLAAEQGMVMVKDYPMPANNQLIVWKKAPRGFIHRVRNIFDMISG